MDLKTMEIYCEVAKYRSFSKGAAAIGISQSFASLSILGMEKELETQLIDRSKRPFILTPAGEEYLKGCQNMLTSYRQLEDRVRIMNDKVTGRVRVAAIYSVGLLQMGTYEQHFHQLYPDAKLKLEYLHPDEVYRRIRDDHVDLGLISFPRTGGDLTCIPWQDQKMVLIVSPSHKLFRRRAVNVEELNGEKLVAFTKELKIRKKLDRWLKECAIYMKVVHEFDNVENIKRAVEIDSGISIVPRPSVRRELANGTLKAIELKDVDWVRPLGIVHKRKKSLSRIALKFIDLLKHGPEFLRNTETQSNISENTSDTKSRRIKQGSKNISRQCGA